MGTPMNGYWQLPPDVIEDLDELTSWVQEALDVAERVGKRPKQRKSAAKKKGRR
jgi:hypothetical protein